MFKLFHKRPRPERDEELLNHFRETDDMSYLGTLFEKYVELVYGVCLKYLKNENDAEDAVMSIFETLAAKIRNHEIKNFKSWLYVLVKNHCLMQLRKNKREIVEVQPPEFVYSLANDHLLREESPTEQEIILQETLKPCVEKLPPKQKRCIELFYFEEMTYKEIAQQEEEELKKVRSYIQNGRRNLKICLEKAKAQNAKIG